MDFIFYEKPYVARNGTHFRVEHIYAQPRYILTSKDTQAGLAQWFEAYTPVRKTVGSNPATDVLTILFSDNPWPCTFCHCKASECILSLVNPNLRSNEFPFLGVSLLSIPTKDKISFPMYFSLSGISICWVLSRNRPVIIRGGVTQITLGLFVVFLVASPADWILREFSNFSSLHATGDMHRYFRMEIWNGFPSTGSSKVLRRCRTSRMLAPGGVGQKRELGIKTAAQPT